MSATVHEAGLTSTLCLGLSNVKITQALITALANFFIALPTLAEMQEEPGKLTTFLFPPRRCQECAHHAHRDNLVETHV